MRVKNPSRRLALCSLAFGAVAACARAGAATAPAASTPDELHAALQRAAPGATILLSPGDYGEIVLRKVDRGGQVTIAAADPSSRPVLSSLTIEASSDLVVRGLAVKLGKSPGVGIGGSRRIRLEDMLIHGAASETSVGGGNGLVVRRSQEVTVVDSEFHNLGNAISHRDNRKLVIRRNRIHDIRVDGIHGAASSDVTIESNAFWNFSRQPGEHPDAIQFWTVNQEGSASNVQVLDNLIIRAKGGRMQGMFITDQSKGRKPFLNLTVRGNVVVGSMYHGITVSSAVAPLVEDNLVLGYEDMKAWIAVDRTRSATVRGNRATAFRLARENTDLQSLDNKGVRQRKIGDARSIRPWYEKNRARLPPLPPEVLESIE